MRNEAGSLGFVFLSLWLMNGVAVAEHATVNSVSRASANPVLQGTIVIKPIDLKNDHPFLRVETRNGLKDYQIGVCNETCERAINACRHGALCAIRGRVDEKNQTIDAEFVVEFKTTLSGHKFIRDLRFPELGEAWRAPDGRIWGDLAQDKNGKVRLMTFEEAEQYCKSIGAVLPSEDDYQSLADYMRTPTQSPPDGNYRESYTPQVLPHFHGLTSGKSFRTWTSSRFYGFLKSVDFSDPVFRDAKAVYDGGDTSFHKKYPGADVRFVVRCMVPASMR